MTTPHRRYNPLCDEWVLVSPQRTQRPWQGLVEEHAEGLPKYDPACFLCPGNTRSKGQVNPEYEALFVFPNDFPALLPQTKLEESDSELWKIKPVTGECHVICYSPDHNQSLGNLESRQIEQVIRKWMNLDTELGEKYQWIQIFENRGAMMGASSLHPHGQAWAMYDVPTLVARESKCQSAYWGSHQRDLLGDVIEGEIIRDERLVAVNEEWVWLVPFWAAWPFETLLVPRKQSQRLGDLTDAQIQALAEIQRDVLGKYDRLFSTAFPFSMGWHGAPHRSDSTGWRLHAHYYPPLLRSATIRKFLVGFELLSEAQRDWTPEDVAARLRAC